MRREPFVAGVIAELPLAVGVVPFGMIYGVLAVAAGLPPWLAQAMSSVVFAGSAQFIGTQLIGAGAPTVILWLTTFVVNLRHALYSASLAPEAAHLSRPWRWLLAYLLTDEAYAMTGRHYATTSPNGRRHYFWLGAGLTLWTIWQVSTAVGIFFGAQVPAAWSLDFTLALTFIALVAPAARERPHLAAALVGGVTAVITFSLPFKLGLLLASVAGIAAGMIVAERRTPPIGLEAGR